MEKKSFLRSTSIRLGKSTPVELIKSAAHGWLPFRLVIGVGASISLAMLLVLVLYITDLGMSVWERLQQAPTSFWIIYLLILVLLSSSGVYGVWRILNWGQNRRLLSMTTIKKSKKSDEASLREQIDRHEMSGIRVDTIRQELEELQRRRNSGEIVIVAFGEVSTGKSSLIRALLPGTDTVVAVLGGTTRKVTNYTWISPAGDRLVLADLPGLNEADGSLDIQSREEALRAHVIIYVCEGDLTRDQYETIKLLLEFGNPTIVALNKIDRYTKIELEQIRGRLSERIGELVEVATVQAGGVEEVTRIYSDGREETTLRERQPQVDELQQTLQRYLDSDPQVLDSLRDAAVFVLVQRKLDEVVAEHNREKAISIVKNYANKAVFGAMAAVSPGTDILIQGYLGMNLIKELCILYEVPVRELDIQKFLSLAGGQVRRNLNLLLAIVGNVFKSFPGMGTVVGGMIHAVVYGLIFERMATEYERSERVRSANH